MPRKPRNPTPRPAEPGDPAHNEALRSRRRNLKEELDRVYYTLPYDEVAPILNELKDTVECLTEMADTHTWQKTGELAGHRNRRRAA